MANIFELENIEVIKEKKPILKIEELKIEEFDRIGIIGANGAGKTTLEKLLLKRIDYKGKVKSNLGNKKIGVHLQNNELNKFYKVKELIEVFTNNNISKVQHNKYYISLNIDNIVNKQIKNLSGGEKQKLILFLVFLKTPDILFFDEPTTGLDYETRIDIIHNIRDLSAEKTLILISHYFNEIELLAEKVLILDNGEIKYFGKITDLLQKFSKKNLYNIDGYEEKYKEFGTIIDVSMSKYLLTSKTLHLTPIAMNLEIAYKLIIMEGNL